MIEQSDLSVHKQESFIHLIFPYYLYFQAFFKFIPTPIALGLVALGVIVYQIRVQMIKSESQK